MSKSRIIPRELNTKANYLKLGILKLNFIVQMSKLFSERHELARNMKKGKLNRKF